MHATRPAVWAPVVCGRPLYTRADDVDHVRRAGRPAVRVQPVTDRRVLPQRLEVRTRLPPVLHPCARSRTRQPIFPAAVSHPAGLPRCRLSSGWRARQLPRVVRSWFGAEGASACPDGLWQRPAPDLLDLAASLGFNVLRLPLAVDNVLADPAVGKWSLTANPTWRGLSSLAILDKIVALAAARGLLVVLDMHRLRAAVWPTAHGLWHEGESMPPSHLEDAWRRLARRFCGQWNVIGADLFVRAAGVSNLCRGGPSCDLSPLHVPPLRAAVAPRSARARASLVPYRTSPGVPAGVTATRPTTGSASPPPSAILS